MGDIAKYQEAVGIIKNVILRSRYQAAQFANREQLQLYYKIGKYVSDNTRSGKWGTGAIEEISRQLQIELPGMRGYSAANMKYMRLFYEAWAAFLTPNHQLSTGDLDNPGTDTNRHLLSDDLRESSNSVFRHLPSDDLETVALDAFFRVGFTHHREILTKCKRTEERWYYIMRCASQFWSVEKLLSHIRANDYAHMGALPNNFVLTIPDGKLASQAVRSFKDEYLLDYINIEADDDVEVIDERVLSHEIIANIEKFIITFGDGFCPIGSQYRIIIDEEEFFIDILLFNRNLNCLVAIELKRGSFKPSYLGQLNFYLSAMDDYVRKPHENKSIGLLLCKDTKRSIVELAVRDFNKPMGVATYRTLENIPEEYQSLKPFIAGMHEILSEREQTSTEPNSDRERGDSE